MNALHCCLCHLPVATGSDYCASCDLVLLIDARYRLQSVIGAGGSGQVFLAVDDQTGQPCAVKRIAVSAQQPFDRIEKEVRIAQQQAAGLTFVPELYGAWLYSERVVYLVMEYIDGRTLDAPDWGPGFWRAERVERFLRIMLAQLAQLHGRGIVHRDLKPSNIVRTPDHGYVLLDFGIAKDRDGTHTIARRSATPSYAPIEQLRGEPTDATADIYSLGAVAYELLSGRPPTITPAPLPPQPGYPFLSSTIMAMIALEARQRPQHAELALDLLHGGGQAPPANGAPARRPAAPIKPPSRSAARAYRPAPQLPLARRGRTFGGPLVVAALVALGIGWRLLSGVVPHAPPAIRGLAPAPSSTATRAAAATPLAVGQDALGLAGRIAFTSRLGDSADAPGEERYGLFEQTPDGARRLIAPLGGNAFAPSYSPDGRTIVFVYHAADAASDDIATIDADGSNFRNLTQGSDATEATPAWSPSGDEIAFSGNSGGNFELFVMRRDGSALRQLTNNPATDRSPVWLPDARIIFVSDRDGGWGMYLLGYTANDLTRLPVSGGEIRYPALAPDGRLAFAMLVDRNWDIYVLNRADGSLARLTSDPAADQYPAWSPDGGQILFMTTREDQTGAGNTQLYVMRADGSAQRRAISNSIDDRTPAWARP